MLKSLTAHLLLFWAYPETTVIDEHGKAIAHKSSRLHIQSQKPHERFEYFQKNIQTYLCYDPIFGLIRSDKLKMTSLIGKYISSDTILLGELSLLGEILRNSSTFVFS